MQPATTIEAAERGSGECEGEGRSLDASSTDATKALAAIRARYQHTAAAGVILGTGLGGLADQ
ncbi:MAG: hypothetical protein KDA41_13825, partial [Planctomycetales bacterium]|nr:hypothetical protein [Planctomycetales bacterium]